jgi:hypothetical protein
MQLDAPTSSPRAGEAAALVVVYLGVVTLFMASIGSTFINRARYVVKIIIDRRKASYVA